MLIPLPKDAIQAIIDHGYVYMRTPRGSRKITIGDIMVDKKSADDYLIQKGLMKPEVL